MKLSLRLISLLLLLFPAAVFAGSDSHKGSMSISGPVQVADKQLSAGEYTIRWNGTGPIAQVNIVRGDQVVATVPARVVRLEQKPTQDVVEINTSNGVRRITMVQFEGRSYALQIGSEQAAGEVSGGSTK